VSIVGSSAAPQRSPAVFRNLPEGTVAISLRLAGYQVERRDVAVRSNKASVVEHVFRRAETPVVVGALSVTTVPEDAEVEIGGRPVIRISGRPAAMPNLPPGPVKVIVRQDGFEPVEQTFQIKPGVTETPTITLRKTPPPQPKATPITLTLPADFTVQAARGIQLVRIAAREVAVPGESGRFKITRPFLIATTEVTQAQYQALMGRNPSARFEKRTKGESKTVKRPPRFEMRGGTQVPIPQPDEVIPGEETVVTYATHPVENVTWAEAMEYCRLLTEREKARLPAGAVFRLPTEAEWWLAADSGLESKNAGWFAETAQGEHRDVPTRPPTERSIHDLQGNVAEWCIDAWSDKPPVAGASDPVTLDPALRSLLRGSFEAYSVREVADTRGRRLAIGGSFRDPGARVLRKPADARAPDIGFRIVLGYPVGGARSE
jgi:formylglycine-generating enzyme required for sulfatase activity